MVRFIFKTFLLCLVLFIGVIIGMQQANEGLKSMRGYETSETLGAFQLSEKEKGELEASILGNTVTSHDLKEKQEQLEQIEAFNFFSELGKWLSNTIQSFVSSILELVSKQLQE